MSELNFERAHKMSHEQARVAMERVATDMRDNYQTDCVWEGDVMQFKRPGVRGEVTVTATHIQLKAKLGVLLAPFKPRIEETLNQNFDDYFGSA